MWQRRTYLKLWFFYLIFLSAGITGVHHSLQTRLRDLWMLGEHFILSYISTPEKFLLLMLFFCFSMLNCWLVCLLWLLLQTWVSLSIGLTWILDSRFTVVYCHPHVWDSLHSSLHRLSFLSSATAAFRVCLFSRSSAPQELGVAMGSKSLHLKHHIPNTGTVDLQGLALQLDMCF